LGRSPRLRWLWLSRTSDPRPALPVRVDSISQAFFNASIKCEVGDGRSTLFWSDPWLAGSCLAALAPDLVDIVPSRQRNRRTVASALTDLAWISDLVGPLTLPFCLSFFFSGKGYRRSLWTLLPRTV
ncbi:hypothetical protein BAE44_0012692, partial [Dichanthelium oligosanthes]